MYAIPILPETLDLIQALNGGVRPLIEGQATWFVWRGPDAPASINTMEQLMRIRNDWTGINIHVPKQ